MGLTLASGLIALAVGLFVWLMFKVLLWILFLPLRILFRIVLAPVWLAAILLKVLFAVVLVPLAIVAISIAIFVGFAGFFIPLVLVLLLVGVVWLITKAATATTLALR